LQIIPEEKTVLKSELKKKLKWPKSTRGSMHRLPEILITLTHMDTDVNH